MCWTHNLGRRVSNPTSNRNALLFLYVSMNVPSYSIQPVPPPPHANASVRLAWQFITPCGKQANLLSASSRLAKVSQKKNFFCDWVWRHHYLNSFIIRPICGQFCRCCNCISCQPFWTSCTTTCNIVNAPRLMFPSAYNVIGFIVEFNVYCKVFCSFMVDQVFLSVVQNIISYRTWSAMHRRIKKVLAMGPGCC